MFLRLQAEERVFRLAVLCLALALASGAVAQAADSAAPPAMDSAAARVLSVSGRVSIERGRDLWAVMASTQIRPGEVILSGPDGYALLQLEDGSKFEVFADSRVVFRANRGDWRDLLDIFLGKVKIHILKIGGRPNPYRVNSATALIAVRGTVFEVGVERDDTTIISVEEGLVAVSHKLLPGGKEVLLKTGETLMVRPTEPLNPAAAANKARIAVRVLAVALDRALQTARVGGGRRAPVPGGPVPAGGSGGGDLGQAPPPPPDIPDGDIGPGAGPPASSGGNAPPPPPAQPPPRQTQPKPRGGN